MINTIVIQTIELHKKADDIISIYLEYKKSKNQLNWLLHYKNKYQSGSFYMIQLNLKIKQKR